MRLLRHSSWLTVPESRSTMPVFSLMQLVPWLVLFVVLLVPCPLCPISLGSHSRPLRAGGNCHCMQLPPALYFPCEQKRERGKVSPAPRAHCQRLPISNPRIAAAPTPRRPMARSTSLRLSIALPSDRPRSGRLAVAIAVQHLLANGRLDAVAGLRPLLVFVLREGVHQRIDDVGHRPLVELFHEARLFLFGHVLVPFGRLEFCGSGRPASARYGRGGSRQVPCSGQWPASPPRRLTPPLGRP